MKRAYWTIIAMVSLLMAGMLAGCFPEPPESEEERTIEAWKGVYIGFERAASATVRIFILRAYRNQRAVFTTEFVGSEPIPIVEYGSWEIVDGNMQLDLWQDEVELLEGEEPSIKRLVFELNNDTLRTVEWSRYDYGSQGLTLVKMSH